MDITFRKLNADEIECRIARINQYYISLLLYKNARVDQNILDETVGATNWQRHHSRDNANCIVSIWDRDKLQWIEKEDTGKESFTEAEKGLASDSFKRACFNWGIGRELYSAPDIKFKANLANVKDGKCYDKFFVENIEYDENSNIVKLSIINQETGVRVFDFNGAPVIEAFDANAKDYTCKDKIDKATEKKIIAELKRTGQSEKTFLDYYKIAKWSELEVGKSLKLLEQLADKPDKVEK